MESPVSPSLSTRAENVRGWLRWQRELLNNLPNRQQWGLMLVTLLAVLTLLTCLYALFTGRISTIQCALSLVVLEALLMTVTVLFARHHARVSRAKLTPELVSTAPTRAAASEPGRRW